MGEKRQIFRKGAENAENGHRRNRYPLTNASSLNPNASSLNTNGSFVDRNAPFLDGNFASGDWTVARWKRQVSFFAQGCVAL